MPFLSFACDHTYESGFRVQACFELDHGVTALSGPSGSGKTTTLLMIAGLLRPDVATIRLADRLVTDTAKRIHLPAEKRNVGLVFQEHRLFPHMTVRQNLEYGQRRKPRRQIDMDRVIAILELGSLVKRYPQSLSGGERQRVALGRALLSGPELLLLDEPVNSLDAPLAGRILDFLEHLLAEYEIPTLLVTHDERHVARLATRVIRLNAGQVAS
jgi:molybdate transport system ATP-binding protein